jgi:hydroxymethylpyrimidine pyrophosphatase-like HAD family hydrolase/hypoxanthine phosphoribosyltransferase
MADSTAEHDFYSRYSWCLNPVLSVDDLLRRFREEIDGYEVLSGWQREESKANLYLFACAVACTADDYFAVRWLDLKPIKKRVPRLDPILSAVQSAADSVQAAVKVRDIAAWRWRRCWDECVAEVCRLILVEAGSDMESLTRIRGMAAALCGIPLPHGLRKRRMRLPEAFRAQDMAHQDVITLIDRFLASDAAKDGAASGVVIMGLRTAGAYFAALMAEYLKKQGFPSVSWFSIRPKNGITRWEARQLIDAANEKRQLLIVDDYPSTGYTFRLTFEILRAFDIRPERTNVLAPTHPAQTNWAELAGIKSPIRVFTFPTTKLHKVAAMAAPEVERLCREYYGDECNPRVMQDAGVDRINEQLALHSKDGHHVREKRVVALELRDSNGSVQTKKLFFKSVGWGWLGYHAYIAGTRLAGFVPNVIGLRNGMLLMEWVDEAKAAATAGENSMQHIGRYVAARLRLLPLSGDCRWESSTYRWTGCDDILNILRKAYGPYVNRLRVPALRKQLQQVVTSVPALIDGRMRPEEWLHTSKGLFKADFEHHNFGGGEQDIVDPAHDLAAVIYEFRLSREDEQQLLRTYVEESGDFMVHERILLYKILHGMTAMEYATNALAVGRNPEKNDERRWYSRNFLVYSMNDYCTEFVRPELPLRAWSPRLFFMDLDGVFDHELLGFPHATERGLRSIALLRSRHFSIVLNTGRGIQHARQYCAAYGFPGGIAEFGSVFLDAVNGREISFVDQLAAEQLKACRQAIRKMPDVFIDPGYEYSIRLYRYQGRQTAGLKTAEIKSLLGRPEFSKLTYVSRSADTYIVQKRTNKGTALKAVKRLVGSPGVPVTAIGDSQHDVGMLAAAEFAYAPANCSRSIRDLAKRGKCRILSGRFQNGLFEAVQHRLEQEPVVRGKKSQRRGAVNVDRRGLMECLLKAADRRPLPQALSALMWWST